MWRVRCRKENLVIFTEVFLNMFYLMVALSIINKKYWLFVNKKIFSSKKLIHKKEKLLSPYSPINIPPPNDSLHIYSTDK
jgi:hypothetical protein